MCLQNTVRYSQICTSKYSQIQSDMNRQQKCVSDPYVSVCARNKVKIHSDTYRYVNVCISYTLCICNMDCRISRTYDSAYVSYMCLTYIQIFQSICVCMCLYVNGIQDHMHLIQPLSESRYIQIHAYTCRYISVCIQYSPCICDMDCLISGAYVRAYVSCMCFIYIHIYQSICVLYVLQIHAHMHWQDH